MLLVGGGASHDYKKWFGDKDQEILKELNPAWVDYTENLDTLKDGLPDWDVVVVSANKPLPSEARRSLMEVVNSGRGLVVLHPGLWYNWGNFSVWNREVCGGGSRGHDKLGEFAVNVTNREHPITAGLPAEFKITDELYYFEQDPAGTPIEVLATATSVQKGKTYPQVFVVKHPKARIAGITLGHDGRAHDLPEFRRLLQQAVVWAAGK